MIKRIIHIGFPKTGSTYLQKYFNEHPEIYYDRQRFNYYLKTGVIDDSLSQTSLEFSFDLLSEELLSIWPGDDSSLDFSKYNMNYDIHKKQKETAKSLFQLFPDAQILIVVRDYRTLVSSLYSQYLYSGGVKSFRKILKTRQDLTLEMYNYDLVIGFYKELFGDENVSVLPYEFLNENPKEYIEFIEKLYGFKQIEFSSQKVHSSLNKLSVPIIRLLNWIIVNYLRFLSKKKRKQKFVNYLEWLNGFKEKLNKFLKFGKELEAVEKTLRLEEFKNNSKMINFREKLSKYNIYYH